MSWRDEKADHLQKSRDFSFLHDDDRHKDVQRSRQSKASDDRVPDIMNQEARDRLLRLKALEKQRADKQKKHYVESSSPDERDQRRETEKNPGTSGSKRVSTYDTFGSFFGKVEKVVAKRVVDEQRAREIAARERRLAEAEKPKPTPDSRKASDSKHSIRPSSASGSRPAPKPQNPVTIKAQKLKDNRDYSFLFSDEPPSKPQPAETRKVFTDSRPSADGPSKQKPLVSQTQKPKQASNGVLRPSSGQGSSSAQPRKPAVSRPASVGERDKHARDSRYDSERRPERDSKPDRDVRYDSERRPEKERSLPSSRLPSVSKNAIPSSKGVTSKLPLPSGRDRRADLERPKSAGHPKPTNHDRRDPLPTKHLLQARVSQSAGQKISSQPGTGNSSLRERVVQKSTDSRISQSVYRSSQSDASAMKRKMVGDPARKPVITAKSNDGRRVDRSRYGESDSESDLRKLVSGGPRPAQSAGPRISQPGVGLKRKTSDELIRRKTVDEPIRRKTIDEPIRRKPVEEPIRRKTIDEPIRRKTSDEPMRSRPVPPKVSKRPIHRDSDEDSDSDGGGMNRGGISSIIQKLFRYNPNKYKDMDDEDDKNMETSFRHIQAEERRSAKLAREEDEREQELIEQEEREERLRKLRRQKK